MNIKNILYPAILELENGQTYRGWSLSNNILSLGEIVFNTGMTGYQEIITDPSYCGQIITFTYPEIGNTGINKEDFEAKKIYIKGIIAKNLCCKPSNWRSELSLIQYIIDNKIPHIFGIDTRSLTKHLRNYGVMNGCISSKNIQKTNMQEMLQNTPRMEGNSLFNIVSTSKPYESLKPTTMYENYNDLYVNKEPYNINNALLKIVILDLGVKQNIINRLLNYGCQVNILPATSTPIIIESYQPDGIILSNGPGDPATMVEIIDNIEKLVQQTSIPIFGICMGHQILSLALGGKTFKLKFGHRGINHPTSIKNKAEITSQNHGFAVNSESLQNKEIHITHLNLNDSTVAGIIHKSKPIFSVQYHPEASPGPHDSDYLFQYFLYLVHLIKSKKYK